MYDMLGNIVKTAWNKVESAESNSSSSVLESEGVEGLIALPYSEWFAIYLLHRR